MTRNVRKMDEWAIGTERKGKEGNKEEQRNCKKKTIKKERRIKGRKENEGKGR